MKELKSNGGYEKRLTYQRVMAMLLFVTLFHCSAEEFATNYDLLDFTTFPDEHFAKGTYTTDFEHGNPACAVDGTRVQSSGMEGLSLEMDNKDCPAQCSTHNFRCGEIYSTKLHPKGFFGITTQVPDYGVFIDLVMAIFIMGPGSSLLQFMLKPDEFWFYYNCDPPDCDPDIYNSGDYTEYPLSLDTSLEIGLLRTSTNCLKIFYNLVEIYSECVQWPRIESYWDATTGGGVNFTSYVKNYNTNSYGGAYPISYDISRIRFVEGVDQHPDTIPRDDTVAETEAPIADTDEDTTADTDEDTTVDTDEETIAPPIADTDEETEAPIAETIAPVAETVADTMEVVADTVPEDTSNPQQETTSETTNQYETVVEPADDTVIEHETTADTTRTQQETVADETTSSSHETTGEVDETTELVPGGASNNIIYIVFAGVGAVIILLLVVIIVVITIVMISVGLKWRKRMDEVSLILDEKKLEEEATASFKINENLFKIQSNEIKLTKQIATGGSGSTVYKGTWQGTVVAVKRFRTISVAETQQNFEEFEREIELVSSIAHPNVVRFLGCCLSPPNVSIVMEFCERGTLVNLITEKKKFLKEKLSVLSQIIAAMTYLHDRNLIHRDLKSENVLFDKSGTAKIIDFGLSKIINAKSDLRKHTTRIGTEHYMSPEMVLGKLYNEKVDVFAFAIICFEVIEENFNPYGVYPKNIGFKVANEPDFRPKIEDESRYPAWLIEVIKKGWCNDPEDRPSFKTIGEVFENNPL